MENEAGPLHADLPRRSRRRGRRGRADPQLGRERLWRRPQLRPSRLSGRRYLRDLPAADGRWRDDQPAAARRTHGLRPLARHDFGRAAAEGSALAAGGAWRRCRTRANGDARDRRGPGPSTTITLAGPRCGQRRDGSRRSWRRRSGAAEAERQGLDDHPNPEHPLASRSHRRQPGASKRRPAHRSSGRPKPSGSGASMFRRRRRSGHGRRARGRVWNSRPHCSAISPTTSKTSACLCWRYDVCHGLRPAVRRHGRADVRIAPADRRAARGRAHLLRPRIYAVQRPLRGPCRARQRASPSG